MSFALREREILGLVGESGCGKSVTCRTIAGLMPSPPARSTGSVRLTGYGERNLLDLGPRELQRLRGTHLSMIFQDPMSALNPVMRVGDQVEEAVGAHEHVSGRDRHRRAIELLERVGIPIPERRMRDYPHQFSGGMRQRVLIAMAIASRPKVLLADEPTTALDVTHPGSDPEPPARAPARLRDEHDPRQPRPGRDRARCATASPSCTPARSSS